MNPFSRQVLTALTTLLLTATHAEAQDRFWIGINGNWNDTNNWSATMNGAGGASLPNEFTTVHFANQSQEINVHADHAVQLNNLHAQGNALRLHFSEDLIVHGNFHAENVIDFIGNGDLHFVGNAEHHIEVQDQIEANVILEEGSLHLDEQLLLSNNKELTILGEALFTNGSPVLLGQFSVSNSHCFLDVYGSKIVVQEGVFIHPSVEVNQSEQTLWISQGVNQNNVSTGQLTSSFENNRTNTCGTGPGETPFTIDAVVLSDYNGQDISCNGAEDAEAFVTVNGGVGPFTFTWIGADATVFTQNFENLGPGTYTIVVNDVGQGINCVDNVQITEPSPLTTFAFTQSPPSCGDVCDGTGNPIIVGGVPGYDFNWSSGETTSTASMLCAGTNSLTVTDLNGCVFNANFTIDFEDILANVEITDVLCFGDTNGAAVSNPSGGDGGPYNFAWSTDPSTNGSINGQAAGDITLTISDGNGCTIDTTFTIESPDELIITEDLITNESCPDAFDGSIDVSIAGGIPPYNFAWTGPDAFASTDENITGLGDGTYTLIVEDDNGCTSTLNFDVTVPDPVLIDGVVTDASCFGNSDGSIDITISGGTPGYTILWDNGLGAVEDPTNLVAGDYEVSVTDDNGCVQTQAFTVGEPDELLINGTENSISCNNANDGSIDVDISGGTPPYNTTWAGPAFVSLDEDISGLAEGSYTLTVIDDMGCTTQFTGLIENPLPLNLDLQATPITCFGANDGSIETSVTEGTAPYNFSWTGPNGFLSTDEDLNSLEPGVYELEVTDDGACVANGSIEIIEPFEIQVGSIITDASCFGFADGAINISMTNGTEPYTFLWADGNGTDEDLSDIEAGDYTVTVTDFNGCSTTVSFTVDQPEELDITVNVSQISCNNANDGSIEIEISGGTAPYNTPWTGPSFTSNDEDIFNLAAGDYQVEVSDQEGCFVLVAETIINPLPISITTDLTPITCNGENDGAITTLVSDGVEPYVYSWTGPNGFTSSDVDLSSLEPGTYILTLTDDNLCEETASVVVDEPEELILSTSTIDVSCEGLLDGEIDLTIDGGTAPYLISWTGPDGFTSSDEDLTALAAGSYDVSVEDTNGCIQLLNVVIDEPALLEVTLDTTQITCFGDDNGAVDMTIVGGTAPYDVLWTGPNGFSETTEDISNLLEGDYELVVSDANNCEFINTVSITEPDEILVDIDATDPSCFGASNGSIELTITQGIAPFTVDWDNGDNGELLENLPSGDYIPTITDDSGCVITLGTITLETAPEIVIDLQGTDLSCFGFDDGSIETNVSGGVSPYTFDWIGPDGFISSDEDLTNLAPGDYILSLTDDTGCEGDANITIAEPLELTADLAASTQLCFGELGSIDASISGGTEPYTITWTGPDAFASASEDLSDLEMGTYEITVEDDNACVVVQSIELTAPEELIVNTLPIDLDCSGDDNGSIEIEVLGGTPPYFITWTSDNGFSSLSEDIFDLAAGMYSLTVEDDNGCLFTEDIVLFQPETFVLLSDVVSPNCFGENTGSIDITLTGGDGNYDFTWTGPNGFGSSAEDLSNLVAGVYQLNVTDGGGCVLDESIELLETPELTATSVANDESCFGDENGSIDVEVSGGSPNYTYSWTGPNGFTANTEDLSGLQAGTYTLTIEDINFCTTEISETIAPGLEITLDIESTNSACTLETGSVLVTINGGAAPYDVVWSDQDFNVVGTTEEVLNLGAGVYFVQVTDDNGCLVIDGVSISDADEITVDATLNDPLCSGDLNGSIDITPNGGTGVYSFEWTGPNGFTSLDEDITDLEEGSYAVQVTDDAGCISAEVFDLLNPDPLTATATGNDISCNGANDGSIELNISGGIAPFNVSWTGPNAFVSADEDIAALEAGTYDAIITDANACTTSLSITIEENDILDLIINTSNITCFGLNDGSIDLSVSGGLAPYVFSWTGPDGFTLGNEDINNLVPGEYLLELSDASNCVVNETITIEEGQSIELQETITDVLCFGEQTGAIDLEVIGGNGTESFLWTGPNGFTSTDEDINTLFAGEYTVFASDEENCISESTYTLGESSELAIDANISNVSCDATDDGSIELIISGGAAPYNVVWTGPDAFASADENITGLIAGTYFVEVQDNNACTSIATFEVSEAIAIELTLNGTGVVCFEANDGAIDLEISGGLAPFDIAWTGPDGFVSTDEDLNGLAPGEYTVVVSDQQGCEASTAITLVESTEIIIALNESSPTCLNADGSIEALVSGGSGAYVFNWIDLDNGGLSIGNDALIENLAAGAYQVFVEDENGCSANAQMVLNDASGTVDFDLTLLNCFGGADGAIDITLSDVEAPFTIEWDGPNGFTSADEDISDLTAGTYSVLVTDALGCLLGEVVNVSSPDELSALASVGNPLCNGDENGTIQLNISGGTAPYTVTWTGADGFTESAANISDLPSGCYDYEVVDANFCSIAGQVCIEAPDLLELNALITDVLCFGDSAGVIDAVVSGGTPNYTLEWVGPNGFTSNQAFLENLEAGQYDVSITDVNACVLDTFLIVGQNDILTSNALLLPPTCFDGDNGEIDLEISGGQAPYTFEVNGPNGFFSDTEPMFALEAGTYLVSITDALSCFATDTLQLLAPDSISITFDLNNVQCFGQNNGSIEISETTGGTSPYIYDWTGPDGFTSADTTITDLIPGTYVLNITDALLCENNFEFEIEEAPVLEVFLDDSADPSCVSSLDGSINVSVNGGFAPYTFSWAGPDGFTSFDEDLSEIGEGAYNLLVLDDAGCSAELNSVLLVGQGDVTAFAPNDTSWCFGDPVILQGQNTLADSQGWRLEDGTQISDSAQVVIDFEPGVYVLSYFATDGPCEDLDEVEITIFDVVFTDAGEDQFVFVEEVAFLGGDPSTDPNATVYWSPGTLLQDSTAFNPETLPMGADQEFILYAVSPGGCVSTDTVMVSIIPEISVPDGFTPNDDGMNDFWVIGNVAFYPSTTVQIYNRWGELLYESRGYTDPWDGTYEGDPLPIGTYYYVIDVREERVNTQLTGPLTIMR